MTATALRFFLPLAIVALLPTAATAQSIQRPTPAISSPLLDTPVSVREQPLSTGKVTHSVQIQSPPGQAQVTVRSVQADNVVGNYRIDFAALDVNGDGFISREEAQVNPALADEFNALDTPRRGKLAREQLAGWLLP
ncbi:EF-hand domain-containing protein [Stenotrophomonas sp. Iso1]|uniref:EF-hand domain-containing protein n=1 Tax=Stenotrophomonas sp. Iso1 TaxID=2977283 RepID=UPI0022B7994F|nr:EF-hand domain-containing protein [Stenotrophomonas sp. Iso1]